jgi:Flp pilus assembly protein TadG
MSAILRHLGADQRGAAIIELALIAPVFALMTVGIVDISNAYSRKLALEQGAQRAIEKIMQTTEEDSVEGTLKTEALCQVNGTNEDGSCKSSPLSASDVTVTYRLECMNGTTVDSSQTQTDPTLFDALTCDPADTPNRYIQVTLTDKYTPMFPIHFGTYNSDDDSYHIEAEAGMRTE